MYKDILLHFSHIEERLYLIEREISGEIYRESSQALVEEVIYDRFLSIHDRFDYCSNLFKLCEVSRLVHQQTIQDVAEREPDRRT